MTGCSKVPGVCASVNGLVPAAAQHDNSGNPYLSNHATNRSVYGGANAQG